MEINGSGSSKGIKGSLSVIILTYNEEKNIRRCLSSLDWCDDVVILDSYSTDCTEEITKSCGARFTRRIFDDYASQRNYGLNEIKYKHPWLLMLDADEIVTPELINEIRLTLKSCDTEMCLYHVRRKDIFMGKWIRYSSGYPTWFGRLARIGYVKVERAINEEYKTNGKVGFLKEHLMHYPFSKGFHAWFEKHNRYSSMEAGLYAKSNIDIVKFRNLLSKNPTLRRKAIKSFVYRMPLRPLLMFLALYIFRGGFLDGYAGFTFCLLRTFYEFMINCKISELRLREKNLPL